MKRHDQPLYIVRKWKKKNMTMDSEMVACAMNHKVRKGGAVL